MKEHELPTWRQMNHLARGHFDAARNELSTARDWLKSDWQPLGSALPPGAGDARHRALQLIGEAKDLIDEAKGVLSGAIPPDQQ